MREVMKPLVKAIPKPEMSWTIDEQLRRGEYVQEIQRDEYGKYKVVKTTTDPNVRKALLEFKKNMSKKKKKKKKSSGVPASYDKDKRWPFPVYQASKKKERAIEKARETAKKRGV